jgi:ABC-type nitrate/sulfonate/bicarbonate transport system permease component
MTGHWRRVRRTASPVVVVLVWQLLGARADPRPGVPTPAAVASAAGGLIWSGELPMDVAMSLVRAAVGYVVAIGLATGVGVAMALSPRVQRWLDPIVETVRPVSPVALVPLAIVWFGPGPLAPIAIVAYAAFFPALLNTVVGVRGVDPLLTAAARTLGIGWLPIVRHVLLPGALPASLIGARLALGSAWRSLILAELLVGARSSQGNAGGIGALMFTLYSYQVNLSGIIACMLVAGLVGFGLDAGCRALAKRAAPWATA